MRFLRRRLVVIGSNTIARTVVTKVAIVLMVIAIGPQTAELLGEEKLRQLGAFSLKGIEQEVRPFEVLWTRDTPTTTQGIK